MKEMDLTIQEITQLMEAFTKNKLGSFKLVCGDCSFELEGRKVEQVMSACATTETTQIAATVVSAEPETQPRGNLVKSPIVGTFYATPAPDKDPYVQVGSQVKKGDVLFIIESMKLMNEVTSDYNGIVTEILVENAQGVEYGCPILRIE